MCVRGCGLWIRDVQCGSVPYAGIFFALRLAAAVLSWLLLCVVGLAVCFDRCEWLVWVAALAGLPQVFATHPFASQKDSALSSRLASLSFVTFKQLEMRRPPSKHRSGWMLAQVRRADCPQCRCLCLVRAW